jgi:hypothetical protein
VCLFYLTICIIHTEQARMENLAPERTHTSSRFGGSPSRLHASLSTVRNASSACSYMASVNNCLPLAR